MKPLFLLPLWAILLLFSPGLLPAQEENTEGWYATDPDMIGRKELEPSQRDDVEWTMSVVTERLPSGPAVEEASLFHDGEYQGYEETEFSGSRLPLRRERYDAEGQRLFAETFRYRPDGSLREIRRCEGTDDCITMWFGLPEESWSEYIEAPEYTALRRFDLLGRPEYVRREEVSSSGEIGTREEEWFRYEDGALAERVVQRAGERELYRYDDGNIVFEEHSRGGRVVFRVRRTFNQQRNPTEIVREEAGTVRTDRWVYFDGGGYRLTRTVNGTPALTEERDENGDGMTVRYQEGTPVAREYFREDTLYRREILIEGAVVRVEDF